MKLPCVYLLQIKGFPKKYIGSTEHLNTRISRHKSELNARIHHNLNLQKVWDDSTKELNVTIFIMGSRKEAYEAEQAMTDELRSNNLVYNIGRSVRGGDNLTDNPNRDAVLEKITSSIRIRTSMMSPEERKQRFGFSGSLNPMYGKTHTDKVKERLSKLSSRPEQIAKRNAARKPMSLEGRASLAALAKKRTGSKNPFYGKEHSDKTKVRLSKVSLGRKPPNERRVMIEDIIYRSITEAGKQLKIPTPTVLHRIRSKNTKFKNYTFVI